MTDFPAFWETSCRLGRRIWLARAILIGARAKRIIDAIVESSTASLPNVMRDSLTMLSRNLGDEDHEVTG